MQKSWVPLCQSDSRKICDGCQKKCPDNVTLKHRKDILLFTRHFVLCSHSFAQWAALSFLPRICLTHTLACSLSSSVSLSLTYTLIPGVFLDRGGRYATGQSMFRQRSRLSHYLYFLCSLELRLQHGHWSSSLPGKTTESLSITNTKCVTSLFYDATSNSIHEAAENIALLTAMFKVSVKSQSNLFLYVLSCAECCQNIKKFN